MRSWRRRLPSQRRGTSGVAAVRRRPCLSRPAAVAAAAEAACARPAGEGAVAAGLALPKEVEVVVVGAAHPGWVELAAETLRVVGPASEPAEEAVVVGAARAAPTAVPGSSPALGRFRQPVHRGDENGESVAGGTCGLQRRALAKQCPSCGERVVICRRWMKAAAERLSSPQGGERLPPALRGPGPAGGGGVCKRACKHRSMLDGFDRD